MDRGRGVRKEGSSGSGLSAGSCWVSGDVPKGEGRGNRREEDDRVEWGSHGKGGGSLGRRNRGEEAGESVGRSGWSGRRRRSGRSGGEENGEGWEPARARAVGAEQGGGGVRRRGRRWRWGRMSSGGGWPAGGDGGATI